MFRTIPFAAAAMLTVGQSAPNPSPAPDPAKQAEARRLVLEAGTAYAEKDYATSARLYVQAMETGVTSANTAYNAACSFALLGQSDHAFKYLNQAVEKGWTDVEHLKADADFEFLRSDPRFNDVVAFCISMRQDFRDALGNPELYDELLRRMKLDQDARNAMPVDVAAMTRIDAENTAWMKEVLDKHGWPGFSMVGKDGDQAAWLLIQHAPDVTFQKRCQELLTAAVEKGDSSPVDLAYLTDRVLMREGKPQIYGTQFMEFNGQMKPHPIEDEANVDSRRAKVGLEPFAVYAERMRSLDRK